MIAVPLVFFLILAVIAFKRDNCFNIPCLISLLFALISFFSIFVDVFQLRSPSTFSYEFSYTAAFFYCFYLLLGIIPLIIYSDPAYKKICSVNNSSVLKFLAIIFFVYFLLNLILSFNDILNVLTGDTLALRRAIYRGEYESGWLGKIPGLLRFPFVFFNMVMSVSWIYIFFAFYCLVIQKLPAKYFFFFIISSLMEPMMGIIGVDRSKVTYWLISFSVVYFFFKSYLSPKQNKIILAIGSFFSIVIFFYLSTMTDARFEDQYYGGIFSGSVGSVFGYLGQSYVNFCYFFDNIDLPEITTAIFLPFINSTILQNTIVGGTNVQAFFSHMTGFELGVFYTYLGQVLMSAGHYILFAFVCMFFWLSMIILRRERREVFSLWNAYVYLGCSSVLFLGLFVHYYSAPGKTFALVFFAIISLCLTKNVRIK